MTTRQYPDEASHPLEEVIPGADVVDVVDVAAVVTVTLASQHKRRSTLVPISKPRGMTNPITTGSLQPREPNIGN